MKNLFVTASHLLVVPLLLTALSATLPAWSDLGKKPSLPDAATKTVPDRKSEKNGLDRKDDKNEIDLENDLKSGKKEGASVKKNVLKKAGAAAAAGVATKKVTSAIKD